MLKVANSVISASRITGTLPVANGGTGVTTSTGTGNTVLSASPTLSGDVNLSTGNLVIGTSGKGIDFSVTGEGTGTMTSELLADYEEGTWTPNQGTGVTVTGTFSSVGRYTKVGRSVYVAGRLTATGNISLAASGELTTNLPFTSGDLTTCVITNGSPNASSGALIGTTTVTGVTAIGVTSNLCFSAVYSV